MTHQEFDALAEGILLALVRGTATLAEVADVAFLADRAIEIADVFVTKLNERRRKLVSSADLLPEEILLLEDHRPIEAIKSVRTRTGMALKEAKTIVDEARKKLDL